MKLYLVEIWKFILSLFRKKKEETPEHDEELAKNLQETFDTLCDIYKEMYQS